MHRNGAGLPGAVFKSYGKIQGRAFAASMRTIGRGRAWVRIGKPALPARRRKQQNTAPDKPPQGAFFFARSTVCADESKISPRLFYNLCAPI